MKANSQQDLQRKSEFKKLRCEGLEALKELREVYELHKGLLEDGERQDLAITEALKNLSTKLDNLMAFGGKLSTEHLILESLCYKSMAIRYEKIVPAHAKTFDWIYHDYSLGKELRHGRIFVDWLAHSNGIFWITGKPGSGKSTLMKYLSHHAATQRVLEPWSGQQKLVVASFYFWYAGTELQKSQEGLLQSLLHEVLRQCPESIPVAVPQRWERCFYSHSSSSDWTRTELVAALNNLTLRPALATKFCFFIDGLDEYDGDHRDLIDLIQGFTKSDHIKWCLSSRPWNVFEVAFSSGTCPGLRLEDLTRNDIRRYVRDEVEGNGAFRKHRCREGDKCNVLVDEVVEKAHGVFLWVFLVVRSLTLGLANADRIVDLQRRLRSLPDDLEEYFQHMLDTIDQNYQQQTAQTIQVALAASEPLTLMTYHMLDELEISPDFSLNLETRVMSGMDIRSRHDDMKLRINARCKDLLQVTRIIDPVYDSKLESLFTQGPMEYLPKSFSDYQVDFLHRTVRDFFHIRRVHNWVEAHVSRDFNYNQSLCAAFLAQIKTTSLSSETDFESRKLLDLFIGMAHYAHSVEAQMGVSPTALLDFLLSTLACHHESMEGSVNITVFERSSALPHVLETIKKTGPETGRIVSVGLLRHAPLAFAVYHNLRLYVAEKLDDHWGHLSLFQEDAALISAALNPYHPWLEKNAGPRYNNEMLCLLISKGVGLSWEDQQLECCRLACNKVYSSWADKAFNINSIQNEQLGGLTRFNASPAPDSRILQWVMCVLKSLNNLWQFGAAFEEPFEGILSDIIETVLERGVNPNWKYGKCTLWSYFVVCLSKHQYSTNSQDRVLRLAKGFLRHGALLNQDISVAFDELTKDKTNTEAPLAGSVQLQQGKLAAYELLQQVFFTGQMEELASGSMADKQETAQRARKRKENQRAKKKRKLKRRKQCNGFTSVN